MTAYVSSVVVATAIVALGSFISYSDEGGVSRSLRSALSILLLYAVVSPVVTLVGELDGLSLDSLVQQAPSPDVNDSEYYRVAEKSFCDGIRKMVCEDYDLNDDDVTVRSFDFDFQSMKAQKIKIILSGSAVYADARGIAGAVSGAGLGECEVELEFS